MKRRKASSVLVAILLGLAMLLCGYQTPAQQPLRDVSKRTSTSNSRLGSRRSDSTKSIRAPFSAQGNFEGVTARIDNLKDLGVTILWLMPIHPIGQEKKKGNYRQSIRSPGLLRYQS
jgi:hypothetical protein